MQLQDGQAHCRPLVGADAPALEVHRVTERTRMAVTSAPAHVAVAARPSRRQRPRRVQQWLASRLVCVRAPLSFPGASERDTGAALFRFAPADKLVGEDLCRGPARRSAPSDAWHIAFQTHAATVG
jgi:hypothetical protein